MGRVVTPTYRVEYRVNSGYHTLQCWDSKSYGRATEANLEKWRQALNKSFAPGGVNYHVSEDNGVVVHVSSAKIIRQSTNEVVAKTKAPMFEVV